MRCVALDLGNRIWLCEVANDRVVRRETTNGLKGLEKTLGPQTGKANVAIEACREAWSVMKQLRAWGHEPILVDTTRCRQLGIGHHRRKNDRIDAEVLARSLADGKIPRAHELSEHRQQLRAALNGRALLVEMRARLIVAIRGHGRAAGIRFPRSEAKNFVASVREIRVEGDLVRLLEPLVKTLEQLDEQLADSEALVEELAEKEPITAVLKTAPGVGSVIASAFISVIDYPERFTSCYGSPWLMEFPAGLMMAITERARAHSHPVMAIIQSMPQKSPVMSPARCCSCSTT